jgi:hypothetical protein
MLGPPGQDLKRIWGNGHFQRMMLGRPGYFKPALFSHLHHLQCVAGNFSHRHAFIHTF